MPIVAGALRHKFVNPQADDPDTTVTRPSDWNAEHVGTIDDTMHGALGTGLHADASTLVEGFYDPGSITVETEHFVVHRDHLKLSGSERLTLQGTSRIYERDLGENNYGPQGELATSGFVILGVPKAPVTSFMVPTDFQHQILNRLTLRGTMRAALVGTADLYIENDMPQGGRITIAGRGVDASG